MPESIAILIGNSAYAHQHNLECCRNDVDAMAALLAATGKYESISEIFDADSSQLKDKLLSLFPESKQLDEIFIYFTGHGHATADEFFFCASDFHVNQPNQTGLSNSQLLEMLRPLNAKLIVQVVDACCSGSRLVKSTESLFSANGKGLNNLIRIAACMEAEEAVAGAVLSPFTEEFRKATLLKTSGPILYTEIKSYLCDQYLSNPDQTPYFSSQETGREKFVEDASVLKGIRASVLKKEEPEEQVEIEQASAEAWELTLAKKLKAMEATFANKKVADKFIGEIIDSVFEKLDEEALYPRLFEVEKSASRDYYGNPDKTFIVKTLLKQDRTDRLVLASSQTATKRRNSLLYDPFASPERVTEYDLSLNCSLEVAEVRVKLIPKFQALSRLSLYLTFAPSLKKCYTFLSIGSQKMTNWERSDFESIRRDVTRKWFQPTWEQESNDIVEHVFQLLNEYADRAVQEVC